MPVLLIPLPRRSPATSRKTNPLKRVLAFLRKTYLWVLALPIAFVLLGAASNQTVLIANHDTFPVLLNSKKVAEMTRTEGPGATLDQVMCRVLDICGNRFGVWCSGVRYGDWVDGQFIDDTHVVMNADSHLKALSDVIDLKTEIDSPGDLFIDLGEFLFGFALTIWPALAVWKLAQ